MIGLTLDDRMFLPTRCVPKGIAWDATWFKRISKPFPGAYSLSHSAVANWSKLGR